MCLGNNRRQNCAVFSAFACIRHDLVQLEAYVKSTVHSANALVGTCKMGTLSDHMAVVDPTLKVS